MQLVHRLRDQDPSIAPALEWLDEQLARQGTTADAVVRDEHQRQVAGSVTVRNIITSMRLISDVDWTELFERVSLVDEVFKAGSAFEEMDFPTRNLYRSAVEHLARGCELTELEVAHAAVETARRALGANADGGDARLADPGYYLIAGGRAGFEAAIGFRPSPKAWPGRALSRAGDRRLCRRRRGRRSRPAGRSAVCRRVERRGVEMAAAARDSGVGPGDRRGCCARQPHRHPRFPRHLAAGAGAARRNPRGPAHAGRRPDAADLAQGHRGADRAARNPLSGEP